jgi:formyltetrahydrofolate-dependent phosphoribosylglycinamide formyltransferase
MKRLAVFVSGSGSNLQALIDACGTGALAAEIALVVSNRKAAYGLERARLASIPTLYFPQKPYTDGGRSRAEYEADMLSAIAPFAPDLLVLAGWMHIFGAPFLSQFPRRVINLHPALPGVLAGKDSLRETYEAAQRGEPVATGCMVHYVVPEVDAGEVIAVENVPLEPGEALDDFAARMHAAEHRLIVRAVGQWLAER